MMWKSTKSKIVYSTERLEPSPPVFTKDNIIRDPMPPVRHVEITAEISWSATDISRTEWPSTSMP